MQLFFFFQAEDGIRDYKVTGVQTCALPISEDAATAAAPLGRFCGTTGRKCDRSQGACPSVGPSNVATSVTNSAPKALGRYTGSSSGTRDAHNGQSGGAQRWRLASLDLERQPRVHQRRAAGHRDDRTRDPAGLLRAQQGHGVADVGRRAEPAHRRPSPPVPRSEEHTSELQSPCNLVCRLLLEKKKKTN